jgi:hypothetical protein
VERRELHADRRRRRARYGQDGSTCDRGLVAKHTRQLETAHFGKVVGAQPIRPFDMDAGERRTASTVAPQDLVEPAFEHVREIRPVGGIRELRATKQTLSPLLVRVIDTRVRLLRSGRRRTSDPSASNSRQTPARAFGLTSI